MLVRLPNPIASLSFPKGNGSGACSYSHQYIQPEPELCYSSHVMDWGFHCPGLQEGGTLYARELQTRLPDLCVVQNFRTHHCETFQDPLGETWNSYPFQPRIQVKILLWNATITYSPRPFDFVDHKIQVDMAILDFSKAFDTVPHDHLLGKMEF